MIIKEFFFHPRNIYYRVNDFEPSRTTLVFVHGLSGSSSAWFAYEKKFEKRYNILSFDLRGHGKSAKPKTYQDYHMNEFAEDLYALLEHAHIKRCILISHSFGNLIVLAFLAEHQNKVSGVILLSPHFAVGKVRGSWILTPLFKITHLMKLFPFAKIRGHVDYSRYKNTGDWNLRRTIADVRKTGLHAYWYSIKQSYAFDGESILEAIQVPVLIVHGKKDTIFPVEYAIMMAEKIKNAQLILLDNADHILVLNHAPEISRIAEVFIQKVEKL